MGRYQRRCARALVDYGEGDLNAFSNACCRGWIFRLPFKCASRTRRQLATAIGACAQITVCTKRALKRANHGAFFFRR